MITKKILLVATLLGSIASLSANVAPPTRVACVGNSITAGALLGDTDREAYPAVLGRLLGAEYEVENFGVSGATLLKNGDQPYWDEPEFREATEYEPQIAVIELGTNDSKPANWEVYAREFVADAAALISHFAALPSRPAIWICLPPPAFVEVEGINEPTLTEIRRGLKRVAARHGARVIDAHAVLEGKPDLLSDGVHPNPAGADLLAQTVAAALTSPVDTGITR